VARLEKWIEKEGEDVLREIGIKESQNVIDFGCGSGVYSIIASRIVGNSGKIYAIDSDEKGLLVDLIEKVKKDKIMNIAIIKTSGEIDFRFPDESIDVIFMYDILHLLNDYEIDKLIKESNRLLKKGGFISYHVTHIGEINLEEIHNKMKNNGFSVNRKFKKPMFHWAWIEDSTIFNFYKE
jgi:ubiquinone/menaquinone biosynthesis C-methylase UbiE